MPAFEALARAWPRIVEDACEALGARPRRRHRGRRPRPSGGVRLLRQQAAHHRRGRAWSRSPTRRASNGSTPSATRAARPTWAGSTTTASASTTACRTSPARSGIAQLERLDEMLAGARAGRRALPRGARRDRRAGAAVPRHRRRRARLVRVRRAASARRRSRRDGPRARASGHPEQALPAGDPPDELLPRALRPSRRASSRSARTSPRARWRCRSSPQMSEGQVERVAQTLSARWR